MKPLVTLAALLSLCFLSVPGACADAAPGRTFVVGVSPNFDKSDRESVFKTILMLALEGAAPRDVLVFYDALNLQPVARLNIPDGPLTDQNPRARIQKMKGDIAGLQQFFAGDFHGKPEEAGTIHLPQFLALAGSQLRQPGQSITVIAIGSPFYRDAAEPAFNMTNNQDPSDGHLLAEQKASVFGVAGKKDALKGISVHYGYLHENFANDKGRERIHRFWTLFIGEQSGVLASFAADLSLVSDRARQNVQQPSFDAKIDNQDSKIQMHRVLPREVAAETEVIRTEAAPASTATRSVVKPADPALAVK